MNEERMQVLRLIESGKVTADEGARILATLEEKPATAPVLAGGRKGRFVRIHVVDDDTNVKVNIPLDLVRIALRFIPDNLVDGKLKEIDFDELVQAIESGANGKLVEVDDDDTHVEIFVD